MRRYISLVVTLSITVLLGSGLSAEQALSEPKPEEPQPGSSEAAFAPGRILVKVKDNAPADALASVNRRNDAHVVEKIPHSRVSVVDLPADLSVPEAIERYEASPEVEYAEPDYVLRPAVNAPTPDDPNFPRMYHVYNRGQGGGIFDADLDAPEAWKATTGSADIVVAVIDTGMDITHRDLRSNIWTNPGESGLDDNGENKATNGVDDDNNGYVDDVHGWDFRYENNSVYDGARQDTHATHVAGIIAAEGNNGVGVTGINWQAKIMPLKFIGADGVGYVSDAVDALNYAVAQGVEISNNSYGYFDSCNGCYAQALHEAIEDADQKGHLFVAAAGNGGANFVGDNNDVTPFYPASYNHDSPSGNDPDNIISVAASNEDDDLTSFSNYGASSVDLAAPGRDILSTFPDNNYAYGYGTSMAAPHVAGVAALIKSQEPQLKDEEIKARILESVDRKASLQGKLLTGGRLNAAKALGANTAPVILGVRPTRKKIRDRTPVINATVRDDETDLTKSQIDLYLDGRQRGKFSYNQANDRLTYRPSRRSFGWHRVLVVVGDADGLQERRMWRFRVVERR